MGSYFDLGERQVDCLTKRLAEILDLVGNYVQCLVTNVIFMRLGGTRRWGKILKLS